MAKTSAPKSFAPAGTVPAAPRLPKIDLDAAFGLVRANVAAVREAQDVLVDAAQAVAKAQYGFVQDRLAAVRAAFAVKAPRKPEAVIAEVKLAAEQAAALAKGNVDLAAAAQRRVVELVTERAAANVDGLKTLAIAA